MHLYKESICSARDTGDAHLIPGSGRSPGIGNGNALRYSCLKNPTDRGAWGVTVSGVAESDMTKWLNTDTYTQTHICVCVFLCFLERGEDPLQVKLNVGLTENIRS